MGKGFKIDVEEFNKKAQHILDTVVKPQVERYEQKMKQNKMDKTEKDLTYWKANAEENYMTTPISVLRYITELETALEEKSGYSYDQVQEAYVMGRTDKGIKEFNQKFTREVVSEYNLDELAEKLLYKKYPYHQPSETGYWMDMYKEGFKKALELLTFKSE